MTNLDKIEEITINKSWYDKLVKIVDELNRQIDISDKCAKTHCLLSHLNGYVHSLDEYFKK